MTCVLSDILLLSPRFCKTDREASPTPVFTTSKRGFIFWGGFLPLTALLFASPSRAQVLEVDQAVKLALKQNPQILAAQRRLAVSESEVTIAGAVPNPTLSGSYENAGGDVKANFPFVEQPLELGNKRGARLTVANAQVALTRVQIADTLRQIRFQVFKAYAELLVARANTQALEEVVGNNERLVRVTQQRIQLGDVPELDLLRAQQELAQAQNEVQLNQNRQKAAQITLNTLMGQEPFEPLEVMPVSQLLLKVEKNTYLPADPQDLNQRDQKLQILVTKALSNRLDLNVLDNQIQVTQAQKHLAEAERTPDLVIGLGPRFAFKESTEFGFAASVGITLPIWYQQQGQIARAEATQQQLNAERTALTKQIAAEVGSAYLKMLSARNQQQVYEQKLLSNTRSIEEIARIAYERGKADVTVPINAQTVGSLTRQRYYQAILDYQMALADLERAVGVPLS